MTFGNQDKLEKNMQELHKQVHLIKKTRIKEHSFIQSSEFTVMKLIKKYQNMYGEKPKAVVLANIMGITQATMTPLIDKLEKKGYVNKETSPTDKRAKLLSLTPKGEEVLFASMEKERAGLVKLLNVLGEEDTEELIRILKKVNQYFAEEGIK